MPHTPHRTLLSWSSGKDSAWALHVLRQQPEFEVVGLITTLNKVADRVAMHAVRAELLSAQAAAAGLPLRKVYIPSPCTNEAYEHAFGTALEEARTQGITAIAFGDLFLEDIRAYRVNQLMHTGLTPVFPLWGRDTAALAAEMLAGGLRAHLTCVDPNQLDPRFVGRTYDSALLAELPDTVDPCGENGEFHSFAWDGPMFDGPIPIVPGERVDRGGFSFADVTLG